MTKHLRDEGDAVTEEEDAWTQEGNSKVIEGGTQESAINGDHECNPKENQEQKDHEYAVKVAIEEEECQLALKDQEESDC